MIDWKLFEQDPQGFAEKIRHRTSEFDDRAKIPIVRFRRFPTVVIFKREG